MRSIVAILSLNLAAFCFGQSFQPSAITFNGATGFTQEELLAASGLTPGKPLTAVEVQAATQRLTSTGLFSEIHFISDAHSLIFTLKPNVGVLPIRFVNFPWWSDAELTSELALRVPLFHGLVPLTGTIEQQLAQALQALLAARQVTATIEFTPRTDPDDGEVTAIAYNIARPLVAVGAISFSGGTAEWTAALDQVAKASTGKEYAEDESPSALRSAVLHVFRARGYAQAAVPQVTHGAPEEEGSKVLVSFALTIVPGEQYRLGSFSLSGSPLIDEPSFLKAAVLKPGDLVEEDKLQQSMLTITAPYAMHGYLDARVVTTDARVVTTPAFHPEQHLVDYSITVTPGETYRMGELSIHELDDAHKARVLEYWTLRPGDPYDASYAPAFLRKNAEHLHALDGYSATYRQIRHLDTHVVDLEVTFKRDRALGLE